MRSFANIYKDRWQIGIFFKALKQNLKIKTFVGTSANAVKIQIWTALIALLILFSSASLSIRLVSFESGGAPADESLYPSGSVGLAEPTF